MFGAAPHMKEYIDDSNNCFQGFYARDIALSTIQTYAGRNQDVRSIFSIEFM